LSSTVTDSNAVYGSGHSKLQATDSSGNKLYYQADDSVSTMVTARPAYWLYERAQNTDGITYSIYNYDTSNLWSPQHGYLTSSNATVIIDPVKLIVNISGNKVYGQDAVTGATSGTTAGTTYDNGYKITYGGLVGGETAASVLTGTITYDGMGQASIVYKKGTATDNAQLNAGNYTFDSSKFDSTTLVANNNNYAISYTGALKVAKANLYINVDGSRVYGDANSTAAYKYTAGTGTDNNINDGTLKTWDSTSATDLTTLAGWSHNTINNLNSATSVTHNGTVTGTAIVTGTDVKGTAASPTAYSLANGGDLSSGVSTNYAIVFDTTKGSTGNFTITPATIHYIVAGQRTYGDDNNTATGSVTAVASTLKAGDTQANVLDVTSSTAIAQWMAGTKYSLTKTTNAGSYSSQTLSATDASAQGINIKNGNNNYLLANNADSFKFTINKAALAFSVDAQSKIYGQNNPTFTGDTGTGWKNSESLSNVNDNGTYSNPAITMGYSTAATQQSDVGAYSIAVTSATKNAINATTLNENYNITYKTNNLAITKADLDFAATGSSTYGSAPTISDVKLTSATNAYTTTADSVNNSEHKLKSWDSSASSDIKTLNGFTSANPITLYTTINGVKTEIGTVTNVVRDSSGNVKAYALADGSFFDANGNCQLATKNYNLHFVADGSSFTVNPKALTFNVADTSRTYGTTSDTLGSGSSLTGFVNGDTITINADGSYSYNLNDNGPLAKTGGDTLSYITDKNTVTTNAGTYNNAITVTDGSKTTLDDAMNNYSIATVNKGDMTVNKADLTFVVNDSSKTYGDANKTLTGYFDTTTNSFKNGDTVTMDSTTGGVSAVSLNDNGTTVTNVSAAGSLAYDGSAITTKTNAGKYTDVLNASGLDLKNYKVDYVTGDMTVNKAQLTFAVDPKTKTYGDTNPDLTGSFDTTVSGFKNGDEINLGTDGKISSIQLNDNGQATITDKSSSQVSGFKITTDATQYSNVGKYDINGTGFALTNYDVAYKQNLLTINKAPLTYTVDDLTKIYGENPLYAGTYSGLKGTNDTTVLGGLTPSITGANQTSSVGTYDLTANFADIITQFSNYDLTTNSGKLTITPANLNFTADGGRDYGINSSVNDFTYTPTKGVAESAEASTANDGKLKSWDSSSASNLSTLEGFAKNGTDALILWTTDKNGNRTQIGKVTSVKFDSNNNIVGYELLDGSFTRDNSTCQLGSRNYNWIFTGGSYKISELPIPGETPYQTVVRDSNTIGGYRTVQDRTSILFLRVIDSGINIAGDSLKVDDVLKYTI